MTYRYSFDETVVGDWVWDDNSYYLIQRDLNLLLEEIKEWNIKVLNEDAFQVPYKQEVKDIQRMIDFGEEQLAASDGIDFIVPGISVGSLRYIKAALLLAIRRKKEDLHKKIEDGWPGGASSALANGIAEIEKLAEKISYEPSGILWELISEKENTQNKGSYKSQQKLAQEEADELVDKASKSSNKDIALLYYYAIRGLDYAVDIVKMTRSKNPLTSEQFVAKQVRLFEYAKRLKGYPNLNELLNKLPRNPGITLAWLAGYSALNVAIKFANMINESTVIGRNEVALDGCTSYDSLPVSPKADVKFAEWRDRTIKEIVEHSLPKPDVWSTMPDIHREYDSFYYKLDAEREQALTVEKQSHVMENAEVQNSMEYDVFISHASEDKADFVEPLAEALIEAGIKVWYDRFELKLGDSLRGKIDEGLANSRYGVVVLSNSFFKKEWPKTELDALVSRQNEDGKKVILPIWHEISLEEVSRFSPILASKLAAQSSDSLESIVDQINNVLNDNSILKKPAKDIKESTGAPNHPRVDYKGIILAAGNSNRWQRSTIQEKETSDVYYWKNINTEIEKINKERSSLDKIDLLSQPIQDAGSHKCFAGIGEQTILGFVIDSFEEYGIKDIKIVTSKRANAKYTIKNHLGYMKRRKIKTEYIEEPVHYEIAHSVYYVLKKIYQSRKVYEGNVIISYSDIVWKGELLKETMNSDGNISILVDTSWQENNYSEKRKFWHDKLSAEIVFLGEKGNIEKIGEAINRYEPEPEWSFDREDEFKEEVFDKSYGEVVGLFKFTYEGAKAFIKKYQDIDKGKEFDVKPWDVPVAVRKNNPQLKSTEKCEPSKALLGSFLEYLNKENSGDYVTLVGVDEGWAEVDCWGDVEEAKRKVALWEKDELEKSKSPVLSTIIDNKRKLAKIEFQSRDNSNKRPDKTETLPAEPPPILKHIKWIYLHGLKHWKILGIALLIIIAISAIKSHLSVGGNEIVNRGLSESDIEIVTRVAMAQAAQLAKQYPGGYSVFGVREQGLVVPTGLEPAQSNIQWDTAKVLAITDNYVKFVMPDILINTASIQGFRMAESTVQLAKTVDAKKTLISWPDLKIEVRVVGISKNMVVVGVGFIPKM